MSKPITLSSFGRRFSQGAGVIELMDDLGSALSTDRDMLMLGGGNPGHVPEAAERFRARMWTMLEDGVSFDRLVGDYGPPQGDIAFRNALAALLRENFSWRVGVENIGVTNGSQSAAFMLFNLLAGEHPDGSRKHICLPLTPEYIGYADQGLSDGFFRATQPSIELLDPPFFKYRVDFDALTIDENTAAICASRPTNPTGNVLTDEEVHRLSALAAEAGIPFIIDGAYGLPFPNIVFNDATPYWDDNTILCLSLSKIGLPGARTGIIVAHEQIVEAIGGVNAVCNLTTSGLGPALVQDLVESGEIIRIGKEFVEPFYRRKVEAAVVQLKSELCGYNFRVHQPEGAIFLWLWFENLPVTSAELYRRLKARGVLVLSGHYFFPGLDGAWAHRHECIRVTYSQDASVVEQGLSIIADEVKRLYDRGPSSVVNSP